MKISLLEIDRDGSENYQTLDLSKGKEILMGFYLYFANGIPKELRIEGDSTDSLEIVRGVALGGGSCHLLEVSEDIKEKSKLYKEGDECYQQEEYGYLFLNPVITEII